MLLRLTDDFAPSRALPSSELKRLRADVILASVAATVAAAPESDPQRNEDRPVDRPHRAPAGDAPVRRSRRRRHAFDLDPRLRAADLRAQERALGRRR